MSDRAGRSSGVLTCAESIIHQPEQNERRGAGVCADLSRLKVRLSAARSSGTRPRRVRVSRVYTCVHARLVVHYFKFKNPRMYT